MMKKQLSALSFQFFGRERIGARGLSVSKSQKPKATSSARGFTPLEAQPSPVRGRRPAERSFRPLTGLTLIELLVVIAIFSFISVLVLANHSRFNSAVLLSDLAYDIALSVRQAQVYGLSVQTFGTNFEVGYGVHVTLGTTYLLFADTNADRRYEPGTDSVIKTYTIGQGNSVKRFCGVLADGSTQCSDSATPIDHLDIVFFRPEPDANISSANPGYYSSGMLVVGSQAGDTRTVTIATTGQISVSNP